MPALWYEDPEAVALLAQVAANPPAQRCHSVRYAITSDHTLLYTGKAARELRKIADRYLDEALVGGDIATAKANADLPVEEAISRAIAARAEQRRAA